MSTPPVEMGKAPLFERHVREYPLLAFALRLPSWRQVLPSTRGAPARAFD